MKKYLILILIFILTMTFAGVKADDLSDVKSSGVIKFGTMEDYIPFVFTGNDGNLDGMDIALIREIGRRMGVQVQVVNMAFDGLIDALEFGQVDVIGGAFAKTDDRQKRIDFSRIYYSADSEFIGLSSLQKPASVTLDSFHDLKIGVQKGTSFDQWIKTNLVSPGYVSIRNIYTYSNAADEIKALDRGDVDLVVLSQDIYEDLYQPTGRYQVFYEGFMEESYAFGLRKNSSLTSVVNEHLSAMLKDGTAQTIANRYFSMNFNEAEPTISRRSSVSTPTPNIPVIVIPTQSAADSCKNGMVFVSDVTITDGHVVTRGEQFRKIWRVQNTGSCTWTPNYTFVFVSGDQMSGRNISVPMNVAPGAQVDLAVDMVAPANDGTYRGYWQMRSPLGQNFGETIWAKIRVNGGGGGSGSNLPVVNAFYPNFYAGNTGTCPTIYWQTSNTGQINISVDGVSVVNSYSSNGAQQVCGPLSNYGSHNVQLTAYNGGNTTYSSFTYNTGNGQDGQSGNPPVINYFYPESNSGTVGNCVNVYWSVSNASIVAIDVDGENVKNSYDATASRSICGPIANVGNHTVTLTARNVIDDRQASFTFTTKDEDGQRQVTPNIEYFYVDPTEGELGDSTTAYWSVSNAAVIDLFVDGNQIIENGPTKNSRIIRETIQGEGQHEIELRARSVTDDVYATVYYTMYLPGGGGWAGSNYYE